MNRILLHKDVYMPIEYQMIAIWLQQNMKSYVLSYHLLDNMNMRDRSHRYCEYDISKAVQYIIRNPVIPFEIELEHVNNSWIISKYCVRNKYDEEKDISVVIRPFYDYNRYAYDFNRNRVVTAWINATNDNHVTLDESKYVTCEQLKCIMRNKKK